MRYSPDSATTAPEWRVDCLVASCRKLVLDVQLLVSTTHGLSLSYTPSRSGARI
jgi:hypothetical protein